MKRVKETNRKTRSLTIRLPEYLVENLQEVAEETDTSKAYHIRRALEIYFEEAYAEAEEARLEDERDTAEYVSEGELKKSLGIRPKQAIKPPKPSTEELVEMILKDIRKSVGSRVSSYLDEDEGSRVFEDSREETEEVHRKAAG